MTMPTVADSSAHWKMLHLRSHATCSPSFNVALPPASRLDAMLTSATLK